MSRALAWLDADHEQGVGLVGDGGALEQVHIVIIAAGEDHLELRFQLLGHFAGDFQADCFFQQAGGAAGAGIPAAVSRIDDDDPGAARVGCGEVRRSGGCGDGEDRHGRAKQGYMSGNPFEKAAFLL
ncbi:MAG: hypothetical protein P8X96_03130 [Desulfobacteraceae bacterium]